MRKHDRVALIALSSAAVLAAFIPSLAGSSAPTKEASWTTSARSLPTQQLSNQSLQPLAAFASAVTSYQEAVAAQAAATKAALATSSANASAASSSGAASPSSSGDIPADWWNVALCEEGGRDDANFGYFGIQEWNGYDGYPSAGAAPVSVQLAWEAANVGAPPIESPSAGDCHGY